MRHLHPRRIAGRRVQVEPHLVARLDRNLDVGEPAQPQLGPLQVGQNAQWPAQGGLGSAYRLKRRGVVVMRAVAEIEAEHINPGLGQSLDHGR